MARKVRPVGGKVSVQRKTAKQTVGGVSHEGLTRNAQGHLVFKAKSEAAKRTKNLGKYLIEPGSRHPAGAAARIARRIGAEVAADRIGRRVAAEVTAERKAAPKTPPKTPPKKSSPAKPRTPSAAPSSSSAAATGTVRRRIVPVPITSPQRPITSPFAAHHHASAASGTAGQKTTTSLLADLEARIRAGQGVYGSSGIAF